MLDRFPNLRLATIESGSMWVRALLRNLREGYGQMPCTFAADPVERSASTCGWRRTTRTTCDAADTIGTERLLFGSDFPHAEGCADPMMYVKDIPAFDEDETAP